MINAYAQRQFPKQKIDSFFLDMFSWTMISLSALIVGGFAFSIVLWLLTKLAQQPTRLHLLERDFEALCKTLELPSDHGIEHARCVAYHAIQASRFLPSDIREKVFLAALLHDLDDHKFKDNRATGYPNATKLLDTHFPHYVREVRTMISLVSASKNGNDINPEYPDWYYYPRWADRLEAIGTIGIERAYVHSKRTNSPMYMRTTPRPKSQDDLDMIPTKYRFKEYKNGKKSRSFIDHFYDKLIPLSDIETGNPYFQQLFDERKQVMVDFVIEFGKTGKIPDVPSFIKKYQKLEEEAFVSRMSEQDIDVLEPNVF